MPFSITHPATATRRLTGIGSGMGAPGAVSRLIATRFTVLSATYRVMSTQVMAVHEYAATEIDNKIAARQGGG